MKRTVLDKDAADWKVFLDGREIEQVVEADDETGEVTFLSRHWQTGAIDVGADGQPVRLTARGQVTFERHDQDPRSIREQFADGSMQAQAAARAAKPPLPLEPWEMNMCLQERCFPFLGLPNSPDTWAALQAEIKQFLKEVAPPPARLAFPGWKAMPMVTKERAIPYAQTLHLDRFAPGPWQLTVDGEPLGAYEWFGIDRGEDELRIWLRPVEQDTDRQMLFTGNAFVSTGWVIGVKDPSHSWGWGSTCDSEAGATVVSGLHEYLRFTAGGGGDLADIVQFLNAELARDVAGGVNGNAPGQRGEKFQERRS